MFFPPQLRISLVYWLNLFKTHCVYCTRHAMDIPWVYKTLCDNVHVVRDRPKNFYRNNKGPHTFDLVSNCSVMNGNYLVCHLSNVSIYYIHKVEVHELYAVTETVSKWPCILINRNNMRQFEFEDFKYVHINLQWHHMQMQWAQWLCVCRFCVSMCIHAIKVKFWLPCIMCKYGAYHRYCVYVTAQPWINRV